MMFSLVILTSCGKENETDNSVNSTLDNGLVAYYPLNGDGNDKSGNDYHLTIVGTTTTTDRFGGPNSAYKFNGSTGDYMIIPSLPKADNMRQFTVSLWIKPSKINYNTPISIRPKFTTGCTNSISLSYENSKYILRDNVVYFSSPNTCTANAFTESPSDPTGQWHHLVLVQTYIKEENGLLPRYKYDQYYDGKLFSIGSSGVSSNPAEVSFINGGTIGGNNNSGNYAANYEMFNGEIDEVRIYNRALTPEEVGLLFNKK
ncbi:hypothetical protein BC349_12150 [Flavihumibacter stibioxidans]|uniref:LamG domain-containing protein n=2 Tax=Flavihumibacter stibioxidans TaxID=1834163 RepID=A0ABR7M9V6_9BACT|nr:hypothetical protein [Flavihumibacter stibioxidans]